MCHVVWNDWLWHVPIGCASTSTWLQCFRQRCTPEKRNQSNSWHGRQCLGAWAQWSLRKCMHGVTEHVCNGDGSGGSDEPQVDLSQFPVLRRRPGHQHRLGHPLRHDLFPGHWLRRHLRPDLRLCGESYNKSLWTSSGALQRRSAASLSTSLTLSLSLLSSAWGSMPPTSYYGWWPWSWMFWTMWSGRFLVYSVAHQEHYWQFWRWWCLDLAPLWR